MTRNQVVLLLIAVAVVAFVASRFGAASTGVGQQGSVPAYIGQPAYSQPSNSQPAQYQPAFGNSIDDIQRQQRELCIEQARQKQQAAGGFAPSPICR